jgi:hypothetical protein
MAALSADEAPGLFRALVRDGKLPAAALAPLVALLPEEHWVPLATSPTGGTFDSRRWPLALDAALATFAARTLSVEAPVIAARIAACPGVEALRTYKLVATARGLVGEGATRADLAAIDLAPALVDAAFATPIGPTAWLEAELVRLHFLAAEGAYPHHVARGLSPTFELAAQLVARALAVEPPLADRLVAEAIALRG